MRQCLGRIHRVGGSKVVQTFVLIAGTIEEKVQKSITNKLACLDTLNDGDLWGIGDKEYNERTDV
jgi:hypothetical protein